MSGALDQRGAPRPQAGACDLGAYELALGLSVSPGLLAVSSDNVTLTVIGFGFGAASTVQVNSAPRETTFVDERTLRVALLPADLTAPGELTLSVSGPGSDLGTATVRVVESLNLLYLPLTRR